MIMLLRQPNKEKEKSMSHRTNKYKAEGSCTVGGTSQDVVNNFCEH